MTTEQQAAQNALQAAIETHIHVFRGALTDNVEVTGDWLLVAAVNSIDLDNQARGYAYHMAFSGGEQPEHVAYGLLREAEQLMAEGEAKG
jgi:hypothetical protein